MPQFRFRTASLLLMLSGFLLTGRVTSAQDMVIFVDVNATGANDGSSWTDAFVSLQDALNMAIDGYEIWVAQGTYYPDRGALVTNDNVQATFGLKSGVAVFGGFTGSETERVERDPNPESNNTILSGDIDDDPNDGLIYKSYHVVTAASVNGSVLDGFTIADGGNEFTTSNMEGIGMLVTQSTDLFLVNLIVRGHVGRRYSGIYIVGPGEVVLDHVDILENDLDGFAVSGCDVRIVDSIIANNTGRGGHIFNQAKVELSTSIVEGNGPQSTSTAVTGGLWTASGAELKVQESTFRNNVNKSNGGGIYNAASAAVVLSLFENNDASNGGGFYNAGAATLVGNTFAGNTAGSGGALTNTAATGFELHNSYFLGNSAELSGGAITNDGTFDAMNLVLAGNNSDGSGGGLFNLGTVTLRNSDLYANTAGGPGGGVYNSTGSDLTLLNSVVWGNTANSDDQIYFLKSTSSVSAGHSDIQGGLSTDADDLGGNLDSDPLFVDAAGVDAIVGTTDDDFDLMPGSPLRDAGNDDYLLPDFLDLDGDGLKAAAKQNVFELWPRDVGDPIVLLDTRDPSRSSAVFQYANLEVSRRRACVRESVYFDGYYYPRGPEVTPTLDFGDGSPSVEDDDDVHGYADPGEYEPTFKVETNTSSDADTVKVFIVEPCKERHRRDADDDDSQSRKQAQAGSVDIGAREAIPSTVGLEEDEANSASFSLSAPAPNPTRQQTQVQLEIASQQQTDLAVFDLLGRRVLQIHDAILAPGKHEFLIDTESLPSGHYFIRATSPGHQTVRKLTIL